jgi:hypothetical protein
MVNYSYNILVSGTESVKENIYSVFGKIYHESLPSTRLSSWKTIKVKS